MSLWTEHVARWKDCTKCPLGGQRDQICLARGQVPADVVFIGEAPGASEDALGQPFVGPAGKLLDQIVDNAMPLVVLPPVSDVKRYYTGYADGKEIRVAFTNLVACFPAEAKGRGDNEPEHEEIKACAPRLTEFVRLCRPKLIVLVGALSRSYVLGAAQFRAPGQRDGQPEWIPEGRYLEFADIDHPAFILRMPLAQKRMATQKAVVVLRNAVARMLNPDAPHRPTFRDEDVAF